MKLSVFTHVEHLVKEGIFYAYSPYVREMDMWFLNVDEVEIVAPCLTGDLNPILLPYKKINLVFSEIPSISFKSLKAVFESILKIPLIIFKIIGAMAKSDHIHIRCPGNIGLIACIVQIFFPNKQKSAKYAGNWDPGAQQPWSYKLQKFILQNTLLTKNINVLVYGDWQNQTKNITPFFTATFSNKDSIIRNKIFSPPYKFLFVGKLVEGKNPLFAIQVVQGLAKKGISSELVICGDGLIKEELHKYVKLNKIENLIQFKGNLALEALKDLYKQSHFLILASKSEGWPKAIAEAMYFGCIPIATPVSCVPWMMGDGKRGFIVEGDIPSAIEYIMPNLLYPKKLEKMSIEAQNWSQQYTMEKFEAEIKHFL